METVQVLDDEGEANIWLTWGERLDGAHGLARRTSRWLSRERRWAFVFALSGRKLAMGR